MMMIIIIIIIRTYVHTYIHTYIHTFIQSLIHFVSLSYIGLKPDWPNPFPLTPSLSHYFTKIFQKTSPSNSCKQYFSPDSTSTLS